jgi:leucyl aminopeptidase
MKLSFSKSAPNTIQADVMIVFVHQDERLFKKETELLDLLFGGRIVPIIDSGDFKGKEKDSALIYLGSSGKSKRVLLIGLGEKKKITLEQYRRCAALGAKRSRELYAKTIALSLPPLESDLHDSIVAFAEGALLGLYRFEKYLSKKENAKPPIEQIILCSEESRVATASTKAILEASIISEAAMFARDLSNAPGNEIYPQTLAEAALLSGKRSGFSVRVLKEREILKLGMGGVMAVSQGSARLPRFIIMEHGPKSKPPVVLVGKGVTFDTGGISIKPSAGMGEMKMDMSGAAAVIGTMQAVAKLRLPVHVVGLVPAVENMPSGTAIRPGDIIRHYNGKTSEVDNTDAARVCREVQTRRRH